MIFNLIRTNTHSIDGSHDTWTWSLEKSAGEILAYGPPLGFGSEDDCRSNIAEVKKAGGALKFAKVKPADKPEAR